MISNKNLSITFLDRYVYKFLPHGKGDPFRAAAYVLDDKDHVNLPRTGGVVIP